MNLRTTVFVFFVLLTARLWAQTKLKRSQLTPYQQSLVNCFQGQIDGTKLNTHAQLYRSIAGQYALVSSETVYREVEYAQNHDRRKLKYENRLLSLYSVNDEGAVSLVSTENFSQRPELSPLPDKLRQKRLSPEARIDQLLFRANIKSDYKKIREQRLQRLVLNMSWSGEVLKNMTVEFVGEKKTLNCTQVGSADICICKD